MAEMKPFKDYLRDNLDKIRFHRVSTPELQELVHILISYSLRISEELANRTEPLDSEDE